jgi:hypothetical protein
MELSGEEDAAIDVEALFGAGGRLPFVVLVAQAEAGA